jgi:pimeloyl-ACP methyl ester carboxylesterase
LRDLLPAAEFRVLPGVGHVPMSDNPDLVARTILDFTERQAAKPLPTSPARH